jgi:hypothetical protein
VNSTQLETFARSVYRVCGRPADQHLRYIFSCTPLLEGAVTVAYDRTKVIFWFSPQGMEKKPNAGGNLRPPCFVGDNQQCVTATEGADVSIAVDLASTGGPPTAILW